MTDQLFFYHLYDYKIELNDERISSRSHLYHMSIFYSWLDSLSHLSRWLRESFSSSNLIRLAKSSALRSIDHLSRTSTRCSLMKNFRDEDCRVDRSQFNDSKISGKYEDLTQQMRSKILRIETARSLSCQHLFSLELISARWLSHILWKT